MTGPEHYREAERLLAWSSQAIDLDPAGTGEWQQRQAQVHATLALAAATADPNPWHADSGWKQVLT